MAAVPQHGQMLQHGLGMAGGHEFLSGLMIETRERLVTKPIRVLRVLRFPGVADDMIIII